MSQAPLCRKCFKLGSNAMFIELQPCFTASAATINVVLCYLWLTGRTAYSIQMEPEVWSRRESQSPRSHLTPSSPWGGPCLKGRRQSQQMTSAKDMLKFAVIIDHKVWAVNFKYDNYIFTTLFYALSLFLAREAFIYMLNKFIKDIMIYTIVFCDHSFKLYFPRCIQT